MSEDFNLFCIADSYYWGKCGAKCDGNLNYCVDHMLEKDIHEIFLNENTILPDELDKKLSKMLFDKTLEDFASITTDAFLLFYQIIFPIYSKFSETKTKEELSDVAMINFPYERIRFIKNIIEESETLEITKDKLIIDIYREILFRTHQNANGNISNTKVITYYDVYWNISGTSQFKLLKSNMPIDEKYFFHFICEQTKQKFPLMRDENIKKFFINNKQFINIYNIQFFRSYIYIEYFFMTEDEKIDYNVPTIDKFAESILNNISNKLYKEITCKKFIELVLSNTYVSDCRSIRKIETNVALNDKLPEVINSFIVSEYI
jgi:hypothetical protein